MLKIRRPLGRLIFNMGIAIPGKTVFLIETAPQSSEDSRYIVVIFNTMRHIKQQLQWYNSIQTSHSWMTPHTSPRLASSLRWLNHCIGTISVVFQGLSWPCTTHPLAAWLFKIWFIWMIYRRTLNSDVFNIQRTHISWQPFLINSEWCCLDYLSGK